MHCIRNSILIDDHPINTITLADMERIVNPHIELLPEGYYLATSDNLQGLVVQARTLEDTIEISKDVARLFIDAQEALS